jgi:hypothetical protein
VTVKLNFIKNTPFFILSGRLIINYLTHGYLFGYLKVQSRLYENKEYRSMPSKDVGMIAVKNKDGEVIYLPEHPPTGKTITDVIPDNKRSVLTPLTQLCSAPKNAQRTLSM